MIIWFTGLSSSGKTTISDILRRRIEKKGYSVFQVDGDTFRKEQKSRNSFTIEEIKENNYNIISFCQSIQRKYDFIIVSVISPFEETRKKAREVFEDKYIEIFLDCPMDVLTQRDRKGLYAKALKGEISNLIGFSGQIPYESPKSSELVINTSEVDLQSSVKIIMDFIDKKAKRKVVLIADYGRSGQGWLSYMLCFVLNAEYVEPYDFLHGILYSSSEEVRGLTSGNLADREKTAFLKVIKTHDYPSNKFNLTDKIVFLSRDPRDVAVSAYFRYKNIAKDERYKSLKDRFFFFAHSFKFISFIITAYKWKKHFQMWRRYIFLPLYFVRYEDLSSDTENVLNGILNYLAVEAPPDLIKESIEKFSFDRVSGRRKGEEDAKNVVFRKGVVGDYKNHFSWIYLKLFKWICGRQADQLGYDL